MSTPPLEYPDLLGGSNPLLEAASPFIAFDKWPSSLCSEPLKGYDWRSVPPALRSSLLSLGEHHYWPNRLVLDIADSIQLMLRSSLMARNPLSVVEQRRINMLALARKIEDVPLQSLRNRSCGGIVSAITGLGKSTIVEHALSAIAPQQVVMHGRSEACGWSSLTQVLYLVIDAPSNGTRGGVLARIVSGLDALLSTDYFDTYRKLRNLDAMLLYVTKLLSNHRVGLLVIDENQRDNLSESVWFRSFVLFFLGLMNLGIPVLLLGNPLAFASLESDAQTMRRFSTGGYHKLIPAATPSETWWAKDFVPGMCRFCLCEEIPTISEILDKSFSFSAGVPGLFAPLWREAQRVALRRGGDTAHMSIDDLELAAQSPRMREITAIASAISTRSDGRFMDIPASTSESRGEEKPQQQSMQNQESQASAGSSKQSQSDFIRAAFEKKQEKLEKMERDRMLRQELGTEDIRAFEMRMEKYAGLDGMQGSLLLGEARGAPKAR